MRASAAARARAQGVGSLSEVDSADAPSYSSATWLPNNIAKEKNR